MTTDATAQVMPESGVKFWAYDRLKQVICANPAQPSTRERLLAGAGAGAASCVVIYPLEVTKTRMAVAPPELYRGIGHCIAMTVRTEGARALFKGLGASLMGIIPFSAVDLALYNTLKDALARQLGVEDRGLPAAYLLGCGAASCSVAQVFTYPCVATTHPSGRGRSGRSGRSGRQRAGGRTACPKPRSRAETHSCPCSPKARSRKDETAGRRYARPEPPLERPARLPAADG